MSAKTAGPNSLQGARNIGPTIAKRLNEIGVYCLANLAEMTPVKAYREICLNYPDKTIPLCYHLYSLQGALMDLHWDELPLELKAQLREEAAR